MAPLGIVMLQDCCLGSSGDGNLNPLPLSGTMHAQAPASLRGFSRICLGGFLAPLPELYSRPVRDPPLCCHSGPPACLLATGNCSAQHRLGRTSL